MCSLFNPAITLALWFIGGVESFRAVLLVIAQLAGGILGAGLVALLTPYGGVENTITTLAPFVNVAQGLFMEASAICDQIELKLNAKADS